METTQFLAPYESSMKPRDGTVSTTTNITPSTGIAHTGSASNAELCRAPAPDVRSMSADIADWNPFEEAPFNQLTEDHLFGAEFDKIRRGSQSSKFSFKYQTLYGLPIENLNV